MSLHSDIAVSGTVQSIAEEIKKELAKARGNPESAAALKRIGRFALSLLEYSSSERWEKEYEALFAE